MEEKRNPAETQSIFVQNVSVGLPTTYKFDADIFYVRDCYKTYYELVLGLLEKYDYISVTGTPGIGKALFYDYFFSRYRREHGDVSIVTAAFNENQLVEKCVVYDPGEIIQNYRIANFPDINFDYPNAIHLYDGAPSIKPARSKMVTFTCPNYKWFDSNHKDSSHCEVYMPIWTLKELNDAVYYLSLNITSEKLAKRFNLFGGVPRYCLTLSSRFYNKGVRMLKVGVEKINSVEDFKDCFTYSVPRDQMVHRLLHYYPESDATEAAFKIASNDIRIMIHNRLKTKLAEERKKLRYWLDGGGKESAFSAWFFEAVVHEKLLKGGTFSYRKLDGTTVSPLVIDPAMGTYERFATDFTLEMVFEKICGLPASQTFKSIDSFIYSPHSNRLLVFQITTSAHEPVNSAGLIELYSRLKLLDRVKEGTITVELIWIVPKGMGEQYKLQDLTFGKSLGLDLAHFEVNIMNNIGQKKKRKLNQLGISNCLDLMSRHNSGNDRVSFINAAVETLKQQLTLLDDLSYLERISQYVMELEA